MKTKTILILFLLNIIIGCNLKRKLCNTNINHTYTVQLIEISNNKLPKGLKIELVIDTLYKEKIDSLVFKLNIENNTDSTITFNQIKELMQFHLFDSLNRNVLPTKKSKILINSKKSFDQLNSHINFKFFKNGLFINKSNNHFNENYFLVDNKEKIEIIVSTKRKLIYNDSYLSSLNLKKGNYKLHFSCSFLNYSMRLNFPVNIKVE